MRPLTERVARMIEDRVAWAVAAPEDCGPLAADILREVRAAMREPSARVRHRVRNVIETQVGAIPLDASVRLVIEDLVDAFARENGLDPPEEQQP